MNIDRNLIRLLNEEKRSFVLSGIAGSAGALLLVGQSWSLSTVVERIFREGGGWQAIMPFVSLFAIFSLLRLLTNQAGHQAAKRGTLGIRGLLSKRLAGTVAGLGPAFTSSEQSGRLVTTMLKGVESVDPYFSQYIPQLFTALVTPLVILAAVFPSDWIAGSILLLSAPLIPAFMIVIGKRAKVATEQQWGTMSRMSGNFLDMLQGLTTLKLFAQEKARLEGITEASESFRRSTMKVLKIAFLSSLALELVGTAGTALAAVSIGLRLSAGAMPFRPAVFILLLIPDFYLTLRQLGTKFHAGMEGVTASKEMHEILDREAASATASGITALSADEACSQPIVIEGLRYTFPGAPRPALDGISCTLAPGTVTALTGPSGAGKSTLLNLLLRFAEPQEGTLSLGRTPIDAISPDEWYRRISWVPQHPFLFNASIRENLLMARPGATGAEIDEALRQAGLLDLVRSLPEGLDTAIGEQGSRLSGGEAQRLSLARAFLKDSPILLLDEPTSNTDPILEAQLRAAIEKLMAGRTVVMIAHRLESLRNADTIIVLEEGRISQSGKHEELSSTDGFFRRALLASTEEAA
ncbi:MAG: thiol reductant ABC exporter subunit CydD [Chlorobiaceae bacterium]|nr:thiol reductant ABC exporter subunit CydD [Chlorobiaceae bacterium]